jgi:hypothetical protein
MTISEVKCRLETWNELADPDAGHGNDERIRLGSNRFGYVFFGLPFPFNAGIIVNSATLHLYGAGGSASVSAITRIAETWKENGPGRVTWDNQPDIVGSSVGSGSGTTMAIDVTTAVDNASDGTYEWHGFRLAGSGNIWSSDSSDPDNYPMLEIDWELPVGYTVDLTPNGLRAVDEPSPTLRWQMDFAGKHRVVVSESTETNEDGRLADILYDSRWTKGRTHELANSRSFPGAKDGQVLHWQVAFQNNNGTPGPWSPVASFMYKKRGKVAIKSPASTTSDATPVVKHTTTEKQRAVQYVVRKDDRILYDSGYVVTDVKSFELPVGIVTEPDEYELAVRVWDDVVRYRNRPTEARKTFTFKHAKPAGRMHGVNQIKTARPGIDLVWQHEGETPTAFDVKANGELLAHIAAEDAYDGGIYKHRIRRNGIPEEVELSVHPVYGRAVAEGAPLTITNAVLNKWLSTASIDVIIIASDPTFNIGSDEQIFLVPGRRDAVQVLQTERGYEGDIAGSLPDYPKQSVTADQQRDNFLSIYAARGTTEIRLAWRNIDIPIIMTNVSGPAPHTRADWYDVAFSFIQTDDFTFTPA